MNYQHLRMQIKNSSKSEKQEKRHMLYLLVSLLLLIILEPHLENGVFQYTILIILTTIVIIFGVYAVSYNKFKLAFALLLAVPSIISTWSYALINTNEFAIANLLFLILFFAYTLITILNHILTSNRITSNEIFGAICVYIMIGVTYATSFILVETLQPGSFIDSQGKLESSSLIYFSFVTIATLGYGDITPVHPFARILAVIEAMTGVLYVAVLIARLVGIYSQQQRSRK